MSIYEDTSPLSENQNTETEVKSLEIFLTHNVI